MSLVKILNKLDNVNTAKKKGPAKYGQGPVFWLLNKTNQES